PATRSSMKVYCIACQKRCKGEVLRVQEKYMHRDCFKCAACSVGLEKGGFFVREAKFYCPDDYQKLFGVRCRICTEYVTGEVITALGSTFHPRCFKCQSCDSPFAPGDRVTQWSNQLYLCKACSQRTGRAASSVSNGNGHHQRALDSDSTVAGGASSSTPLSRAYPQHLAYQQHQHSPTSFSCPSESGLGDRGGGSSSIIGGSGSVVHRRFPSGFGSHLLARSYLSMEQETEQRTHPNDRYRRTTSPSVCGSVTGSGAPSPQHFHLPPSRVSRQASLASRSTHPGSVAAGGSGRRTPRSLSPSPGDDPLLLSLPPVCLFGQAAVMLAHFMLLVREETVGNGAQDESDADSIRQQHRGSRARMPLAFDPPKRSSNGDGSLAGDAEELQQRQQHGKSASLPQQRNRRAAGRMEDLLAAYPDILGLRPAPLNPGPSPPKLYPYEALRCRPPPKDADPARLEEHLDEAEFAKVFRGLPKRQFCLLPEWKRNDMKRKVGLF
uniref:Actin-binding lim zn-finger protein limatin involved in axon guidance n=1 Tax=Macrostomum lignano TaxID=282301 RepID=A0A1I8HFR8_9PLAT